MARLCMADVVQSFLQARGICSELKAGKGHDKVVFAIGGQKRTYVCARSVSDRRAVANATADLRRMVRESASPA